jgi:hypothetical protein
MPRFSIAGVLVFIAICAIALAALSSPSNLWANVTFSLALGSFGVALISAFFGKGAVRAYWLGFLLCAGTYYAMTLTSCLGDSVGRRLITEAALDLLYSANSPDETELPSSSPDNGSVVVGAADVIVPTQMTYSPTTPAFPLLPSSPWVAWTEPDRALTTKVAGRTGFFGCPEAFHLIGHSMFTLLFGVMGGIFARRRYRASTSDASGLQAALRTCSGVVRSD